MLTTPDSLESFSILFNDDFKINKHQAHFINAQSKKEVVSPLYQRVCFLKSNKTNLNFK